MSLLIQPPMEFFTERDAGYFTEFLSKVKQKNPGYEGPKSVKEELKKSYSAYNYFPGGITSSIKTGHFEAVLRYTKKVFEQLKPASGLWISNDSSFSSLLCLSGFKYIQQFYHS